MVNRYFTIANLLLITAGVYLCVNLFYTLAASRLDYGETTFRTMSSQADPTPVERTIAPLSDYKAIISRNVFNSGNEPVAETPKTDAVDIDKLKETDLKLKLWGTVTGQNKRAYAVIFWP